MAKAELRIVEPVGRAHDNLTVRQAEVHQTMLEYQADHGLPASIRELRELLDLASTNGVVEHLEALERKGYATRTAGRARCWVAHRRGDCPRAAVIGVLSGTLDVKPDLPLGRLLLHVGDGRLASMTDRELADAVAAFADRWRGAR